MYLCPHLVRRQTLKSPRAARASVCVCAVNETARLCHSLTEMQNMQDSYLKCFCGLICIDTRVEPDTRLKRVSGTDKALLPSTSIIRVIRVNICARIE